MIQTKKKQQSIRNRIKQEKQMQTSFYQTQKSAGENTLFQMSVREDSPQLFSESSHSNRSRGAPKSLYQSPDLQDRSIAVTKNQDSILEVINKLESEF